MKKIALWSAVLTAVAVPAAAQDFSRAAAIFDGADTNGDGAVSRAEFSAARVARFDMMDRDGDGAISRGDLPNMRRIAERLGPMIDSVVAQSDVNRDGKVTRAELANGPMPVFDRADVNRDGHVDKAELAVARERLAAMRKDGR